MEVLERRPEGVDANGQPTGNLSLHDGDRLALEFPVINNGDINWTGGATVEVLNGALHELVSLTTSPSSPPLPGGPSRTLVGSHREHPLVGQPHR